MKSYEIISIVAKSNPSITHFLLRIYKKTQNIFKDVAGDFSYEWLEVANIKNIETKIQEIESNGNMIGLTSMVMTEKGIQSLLILDYSLPQSSGAEKEIIEKISAYNQSDDASYRMDGFLIRTNASYHYLGKYITSKENFIHFLGSALLFRENGQTNFVVDDRWLGHSFKKGFGTIRIGKKDGKEYPSVIKEIK